MPKLERYLLFAGDTYYPSGGWSDFQASFDTMLEAQEAGPLCGGDWWHVVDTESNRVVSNPSPDYINKAIYGGVAPSPESTWVNRFPKTKSNG